MPDVNTVVNSLQVVPLFQGLSEDELRAMCEQMRTFSLKQGELLFQKGDPGNSMFVVVDGKLRVYTLGESERQVLLDVLGPGDVLGELTLLDGRPRTAYAQAETDCDLLALDREPFLAHLRAHVETAIALLSQVSARLRQTVLQTESIAKRDSAARLAQVILFLAEQDGEIQRGVVTSRLRRKDLAAAIGTSVEWVTQTLTEWSRDGIIGMTGPRRLLLHDADALRAIASLESES